MFDAPNQPPSPRRALVESLERRTLLAGNTPYLGTAAAVPGTVQAESYDSGGEGVAYHDTTSGNAGGAYRSGTNVDIVSNSSTVGGYSVGYIRAGEWLEYTVKVASSGTYSI